MTRLCEHPDTQGSRTRLTAGRDLRGISLAVVLKLCGQEVAFGVAQRSTVLLLTNILRQRSLRTWCSKGVTSSRNANGD